MPRKASTYSKPITARQTLALGLCLAVLSGCQHLDRHPRDDLQRHREAAVAALDPPSAPTPAAPEPVSEAIHDPPGFQTLAVSFAETAEDETLLLSDVILSVYDSYPLFEVALRQRDVAAGREMAAWGEFDTVLRASSLANPMGYYQRYRTSVRVDQPLYAGGNVYAGYKIGRGAFHPAWYDAQTDLGGEFSLGLGVPLLKDRVIDKRRSGVMQASLARQAVEPEIQAQWLGFVRDASRTYWDWVGAGQILDANRQLLRLAEDRVEQIEQRVLVGDLERIARIDNQRLIALRETKVIESQRKLQMAAIRLSLFLRTPDGRPQLPSGDLLPERFPPSMTPDIQQMQRDIQSALAGRPELVELDLLLQQIRVELAQAENSLLPKLDALVGVSQDVGHPVNERRTKSLFELEAGVYGEMPLQWREARGKILAARGRLMQVNARREFMADRIVAEVQDALSALEAAAGQIEQTARNLQLSREALELGRVAFEAGDVDLIVLNIYEQAVGDAGISWIEAQTYYFTALADYQAALARDPLGPGEG
jgi:outer membrane protein TolC